MKNIFIALYGISTLVLLASLFYFFPPTPDGDTVWCNENGGRVFNSGGLFSSGKTCIFPPNVEE